MRQAEMQTEYSDQFVTELQHKIRLLEQSNSELVAKNLFYEEAIHHLEQNIAELTETDVLRELIDEISHDLRLPLSTITNYLYLLKHTEHSETSQRYLAVMDRQVSYLTDVVNNLIHMARLDLDITQFDVKLSQPNQILQDVVDALQPVASEKGQVISIDVEPGLPPMLVDNVKITRAVMNIVQNAITYTPAQGRIDVRSSVDRGGYIVIEIADTGIGICPDDLPHIFDRFYRVNRTSGENGSVGLGLAITKRIIENHRGRIEVESVINSGTVFRIFLPTLAALSARNTRPLGDASG
ncbi:MAG: hypothetical protein F9K46_07500 [Anaerolineae bacterium]|nr:MAG: hypothetical protein F9K46_07500 [Anaerolineae bacterium]